MIHGYVNTQLVCVAAKLGIADHLSAGPRRHEDLATLIGIPSRALFRLLRGLVKCGLLRHCEDGQFELSPLGEVLKSDAPGSLRDLALRVHALDYPAWGALLNAVETETTAFDSIFGASFYDHLARSESDGDPFNDDMSAICAITSPALLGAYDFSWAKRIIDVGGGQGVLLSEILRANPSATGVLFDSPSVIARAVLHLNKANVSDRCSVIGGDFFEGVPEGGDLYILSLVLHNWNNECTLKILANVRKAMDSRARLLIIDRLMPERVDASTEAVGPDLTMMVLVGGIERTRSEFELLFQQSGFATCRIVSTPSPLSLIEVQSGLKLAAPDTTSKRSDAGSPVESSSGLLLA
jgi:hypothetical protein